MSWFFSHNFVGDIKTFSHDENEEAKLLKRLKIDPFLNVKNENSLECNDIINSRLISWPFFRFSTRAMKVSLFIYFSRERRGLHFLDGHIKILALQGSSSNENWIWSRLIKLLQHGLVISTCPQWGFLYLALVSWLASCAEQNHHISIDYHRPF